MIQRLHAVRMIAAVAVGLVTGMLAPDLVRATCVVYVDNANPACSDIGPGSEWTPYCRIAAAVAAHGCPGATIYVRPGVYREQVTVGVSGSREFPLLVQALGGSVVVDGADDFSTPAKWSAEVGTVFRAASVTWSPKQVLVDGSRLTPSTAAVESLAVGAFRHVEGSGLFVNLGGDSPGFRDTRVSRRSFGFRITGQRGVTIDGFTVVRAEERGIDVTVGSSDCTVTRNTVSQSGRYGIAVTGSTAITVGSNTVFDNADHGIVLFQGVTGSILDGNESFLNARPGVRAANGIQLNASPGNLVQRNRIHHNQDTGLEIRSGSDDCRTLQNVSWSNGDHGYQIINSSGAFKVGDVAWGNTHDGISIEGGSSGARVHNCISVDNGLTESHYDLYVDGTSAVGLQSDYNLFWNSTTQPPLKVAGTTYASVAAFSAATGRDMHSLQANPSFVDPSTGDFHLAPGSPAIDAGTSEPPGWPIMDAELRTRADDPDVINLGTGPIDYADRGAYERLGVEVPNPGPPPPTIAKVSAVFPNPTPAEIGFVLELPSTMRVGWTVHDLQGRLMASQSTTYGAGRWRVCWTPAAESRRLPAGVYLLRVTAGQEQFTRRVVTMP